MPHLRLALAAGGLLLALPTLSSCGFDYPTERDNTVGAGVTQRDALVDVGGAKIVAGQPDKGTLIAALTNNTDDPITLTTIAGGEEGQVQADGFTGIEVPPAGHINLAALAEAGQGLTVSGDFDAGHFVTVTFGFDNDESVTVDVPVMKPCFYLEGLDSSGGEPSTDPLYSCEPDEADAPAEH
jgi:hypothetical protein